LLCKRTPGAISPEKPGSAKLSQCVSKWDAYHYAARGGFQSGDARLNGIKQPEVAQAASHGRLPVVIRKGGWRTGGRPSWQSDPARVAARQV